MTYEVGLSRGVRAFHIMPGLPGPEGQLHDHDYRIEVVVDRERLDGRGMVCDLDVLAAAMTELAGRIDGRNLEEIRPASAEAVTVEVSPAGCMTHFRPLWPRKALARWPYGYGKLRLRLAGTAHHADDLPDYPG